MTVVSERRLRQVIREALIRGVYLPRLMRESAGESMSALVARVGNIARGADQKDAVMAVQQRLKDLGQDLTPSGTWDDATEKAVRDFQTKSGVAVDGIVGPETSAAMDGDAAGDTLSSPVSRASGNVELHVGKLKRPSVESAIEMLRPTLDLYDGDTALATAALTNAFAESGFDHLAAGDVDPSTGRPASIGLFQLYDKGAGKGMSAAERADPMMATERILQTARAAGVSGAKLSDPPSDRQLLHLVARFTEKVERPAQAVKRGFERAQMLASDEYLRAVLSGLGLPIPS